MLCSTVQSFVLCVAALAWAGDQFELRAHLIADGPQYCWSETQEEAEKEELQSDWFLANIVSEVPEVALDGYVPADDLLLTYDPDVTTVHPLRGPPVRA